MLLDVGLWIWRLWSRVVYVASSETIGFYRTLAKSPVKDAAVGIGPTSVTSSRRHTCIYDIGFHHTKWKQVLSYILTRSFVRYL